MYVLQKRVRLLHEGRDGRYAATRECRVDCLVACAAKKFVSLFFGQVRDEACRLDEYVVYDDETFELRRREPSKSNVQRLGKVSIGMTFLFCLNFSAPLRSSRLIPALRGFQSTF